MIFPEPNPDFADSRCPRGLKNDSRQDTKSQEKYTRGHVFASRATGILFSSSFAFLPFWCRPGGFGTLKVVKNIVGTVRNRRIHFFKRKQYFTKKSPSGIPKRAQAHGTHPGPWKDPFWQAFWLAVSQSWTSSQNRAKKGICSREVAKPFSNLYL